MASKQVVGIFDYNPFELRPKLFDTGMRFYIGPDNDDLEAWGLNDASQQYAEQLLSQLHNLPEVESMTSDEFIQWCINEANETNVIGMSRVFADPMLAQTSGIIDSSTIGITAKAAAALR